VPGYRLGRRLGAGGFGVVYLGRAERTGLPVAVKFLREERDRDRFRREIRILVEQRRNPHVVDVLAFHVEARVPYVVLELCAGGSLRALLASGQGLGWATTATILSHAAAGLAGVHRAGGFHRDVKPDNLLVAHAPGTRRRIVKVGDFGLARVPAKGAGGVTCTGRGTPGYMAPEVLAGQPFSAAADVYALGVVGRELLSGQSADVAFSPPPATPSATPGALLRLLRDMGGARPSARPTLGEIRRELRALLTRPAAVA
jgi:serine/threonine-protein kinase